MKVKLAIILIVLTFVGCSIALGHRDGPSYGEQEMQACQEHGGPC